MDRYNVWGLLFGVNLFCVCFSFSVSRFSVCGLLFGVILFGVEFVYT
jgi:hypothetical protein